LAVFIQFEDDTGTVVADVVTNIDKYLMPDGSQMVIEVVPAWCCTCRTIVVVESLQSPDEMERKVRETYGSFPKSAMFPPQVLASNVPPHVSRRMLDAARWRIVWELRKSPPRCLECGGTDFLLILEASGWIRHPGDPQRKIHEKAIGFVDMARAGRLYDIEGRLIPGRDADHGF